MGHECSSSPQSPAEVNLVLGRKTKTKAHIQASLFLRDAWTSPMQPEKTGMSNQRSNLQKTHTSAALLCTSQSEMNLYSYNTLTIVKKDEKKSKQVRVASHTRLIAAWAMKSVLLSSWTEQTGSCIRPGWFGCWPAAAEIRLKSLRGCTVRRFNLVSFAARRAFMSSRMTHN